MSEQLSIVRRIIDEHQVIRQHIGAIGETINDRASVKNLNEVTAGWVPGRKDMLVERQSRLKDTLEALVRGLEQHFGYEEAYLPELTGELVMRSILLDHRDIRALINNTRLVLQDRSLEGLSQAEVLTAELELERLVTTLSRSIEEHAFREEVVLAMLERALTSESSSGRS